MIHVAGEGLVVITGCGHPTTEKLVALSPHDNSLEVLEAFQSVFTDRYYTLTVGETIQFP